MAVLKKNYGRVDSWRNQVIADIVASLTDLGQEACQYAIDMRGYNNRTYNLRDSIGSAVYVDGKIVPSSKRYAFRKSSKKPYPDKGYGRNGEPIEGREALDRYWDENKTLKNSKNTIELVVVAGTFYSGILEDRGIQVISAAVDYLESNMSAYKTYNPTLRASADMIKF